MGNVELVDSMIYDGLWSTFSDQHMGESSDEVNTELGISRDALAAYWPSTKSVNRTGRTARNTCTFSSRIAVAVRLSGMQVGGGGGGVPANRKSIAA